MNSRKILCIAVCFIWFACFSSTAKADDTPTQVERLMAGRVSEMKRGADIKATATRIADPLKSPFELYRVSYTNAGQPMGAMTVSVIEKEGKKYLINGGAIWDIAKDTELQILWRSLTETAEIPYLEDHLIAGKVGCKLPVAVFSDYLCVHCKRFMPEIKKMVSENADMCLYYYDLPLTSIHKTAKYVAQLSIAYKELAGESVPDSIHGRNFNDEQSGVEEYFEDLIKTKNISPNSFYKKASSPEIASRIENDMKLAKDLGIQGTPSAYIAGHSVIAAREKINQLIGYLLEMENQTLATAKKGS